MGILRPSSQWLVPSGASTGAAISIGVLRLIDGEWVLDTDPTAEADGYLLDVDGEPVIDDTVTSGQRVFLISGDIVSY